MNDYPIIGFKFPDDYALIKSENSFYISKYLVTQEFYSRVAGENPSYFKGEKRPVECVSWYDAVRFCNVLSVKEGKTPVYAIDGNTDVQKWNYTPHKDEEIYKKLTMDSLADGFRLPTLDEWKLAAAGGQDFTYAGSNDIDEVAWFGNNSGKQTHEVAQKKPNGYGLYDMSGNVWEWTWDTSYSDQRCCGGSWYDYEGYCEVGFEYWGNPKARFYALGFRLACRAMS